MFEQESIMYYPFRHEANFKESSLNSTASTLLDTGASGRPFTSFSGQSSTSPVFNHGGGLQGFNNVQASYNMPTMPSALSSRNSGATSHQPASALPSGRYPSSNLPIGLSQLSQNSLHGHNAISSRAGLSVVGNHPLSSSMNAGGVSGPGISPGSVSLGSRGSIGALGGSLSQMGASGPRVQSSVGNIAAGTGAGSLNRTLSSGGGLSIPSLSGSRMNMGPISNAGGLGPSGRAISPMLQQGVNATYSPSGDILALIANSRVHPQMVSMISSNFSSSGGGMQGPSANGQLASLGLGDQADGAPFDMSDFPLLSNRQNSAVLQANFRKQGVTVNSLAQQNQEFSIQNEDFPALPGFKGGNSDVASDLHSKDRQHDSSLGVMQQQHFGMGRSAGFPLGVSFVARQQQQQQQQQQLVSGSSATLSGDATNLSHLHGSDNFPASHGLSASYHSPAGSLGSLRSASPAVGGSYEQLLHQYEHQQQSAFRLGAHHQHLTAVGQAPRDMRPEHQADRFGLLGLLSVIRMTDQDLTTLALGTDLTTLGLNLNSRENLYKTFASPWAEGPVKGEPEFTLPQCYVQQAPRLQPGYFAKLADQTLIYIFYSMPEDEAQLYAANELCRRGWHYHKGEQMWCTRAPGADPVVKTATLERGPIIFYNQNTWEAVRKDNYVLQYEALEKPPQLPAAAAAAAGSAAAVTGGGGGGGVQQQHP